MKKRFWALDTALALLSGACLVLCIALAAAKPQYLLVVIAVLVVWGLGLVLFLRHFRRMLARFLRGGEEDMARSSLAALELPVLVLTEGRVAWYNDAYLAELTGGEDTCLLPVERVLPGLDLAAASEKKGQDFSFGGQRYTVYGAVLAQGDMHVLYFVNNTVLKRQAGEYLATRPSVMLLEVDTYDEILKELREAERTRIMGQVEAALEQFIGTTTGFLRRVGSARYLAVVEERHMQDIVKARFAILDMVRGFSGDEGVQVTLSIGVGRLAGTLAEGEEMAAQALDMALGRGGDQAAVCTAEGFSFFGGVSRGVEKRSKVKSRIIAAALKDLMGQSTNVLVMGHKSSDLDSLGASIGMARFAKICHKPVAVVVDESRSLAQNLIEEMREAGEAEFQTPAEAIGAVKDGTLVVIVDTHMPYLLESEDVYRSAANVVVIDHHRKCVGHIDNGVIFYHEPYASSASELVSELLQYLGGDKEDKLTPAEAQALLAGIMLDTRNFALHTGVRTFEAAAYLRRMGAQTQAVKRLFNSSFQDYAYKAQLVTEAEIYLGCAVVVSGELPPEHDVVVPQAANDLLSIDGVEASFVAVDVGGQINISARSMGDVNVQLVMEQLGGGGHLTMAGVQLRDVSLEEAKQRLLDAIAQYRATQTEGNKKK